MFAFRQATVDASKLVVGDRARRQLKLRMVAARSHCLVKRRPLPAFLIIGTMRGGTSSLFKYLDSHPETGASLRKEIRFFTRYWDKGLDWYRAHFPITRRRLTFEATPDYLFHPFAPMRAAETVPETKLIVLLREPVARALSHYQHMVRLGLEQRSFAQALEEEDRLIETSLARFQENDLLWQPKFFQHSYLSRGSYAAQLERWLCLYPKEKLLILWSEDLYRNPRFILQKIAKFLDIIPGLFSGLDRNYSQRPPVQEHARDRGHASPVMPAWAVERLAHENDRLSDLLRRRLPAAGLPPWLSVEDKATVASG